MLYHMEDLSILRSGQFMMIIIGQANIILYRLQFTCRICTGTRMIGYLDEVKRFSICLTKSVRVKADET